MGAVRGRHELSSSAALVRRGARALQYLLHTIVVVMVVVVVGGRGGGGGETREQPTATFALVEASQNVDFHFHRVPLPSEQQEQQQQT